MSEKLLECQQALQLALEEQTRLRQELEQDPINEEKIKALGEQNDKVDALEAQEQLIKRSEDALARSVAAENRILHAPEPKGDGLPGHAVTSGVQPSGLSDPRRGFQDYGQFLNSVKTAAISQGLNIDPRLRIGAATGASTLVGPDGGFATPPMFETTIWDGIMRDSPLNLMSRCDQRPVTGRSVTFNADAETSQADGSRHGGILGYWLNEGGTATASKPTFRQLTLKPKKLMILSYATEELLEDAPSLQAHLEAVVADEISYMVNRAIVRGTGPGEPLGILNAGCLTTVSAETGQTTADPLLAPNIDKMYARMIPESRVGAVWLINPGLEPYLQAIGREVGVAGVPAYMPAGGLSASPFGTLKGLPVLPCMWCSAYNTTGDILLCNFQGYLLGTKQGVRSESSIHVQFTTDERAFRFIFRVDGQPWRASALTGEFAASGETYSDFVALETRS